MTHIQDLIDWLESFAPLELAESWDNVGLLVGDAGRDVSRVMTCLTLTSDVAREAIDEQAGLIVTHHPVLFKAAKRLTADTPSGRVLLDLISAGVSVYSPHTAFDSAADGINRQLAQLLGVQDPEPLRRAETGDGAGRYGQLTTPCTLRALVESVRETLSADAVQFVGDPDRTISRIAIACGAAAEFLDDALAYECDALLTGEARFHACLEARERGLALILPGHYASERHGVEHLADTLGEHFPTLKVWASRRECDPLDWSGS